MEDDYFGSVTLREVDEDVRVWGCTLVLPSGTLLDVELEGESETQLPTLLTRGRLLCSQLVTAEDAFMVQVANSLRRILNKRIVRNEVSDMSSDEIRNAMSNPHLSLSADEPGGILYFDIDIPGDRVVAVHLNRKGVLRSTILE